MQQHTVQQRHQLPGSAFLDRSPFSSFLTGVVDSFADNPTKAPTAAPTSPTAPFAHDTIVADTVGPIIGVLGGLFLIILAVLFLRRRKTKETVGVFDVELDQRPSFSTTATGVSLPSYPPLILNID